MNKWKSRLVHLAAAVVITAGSLAGILALTGTKVQAYTYTRMESVTQTGMTQNSVTVSYAGSTASSYQIYYKLDDYQVNSDYVLAGTTSATSYTIGGLQAGCKYYIKVQDAANSNNYRTLYGAETQVGNITGLTEDRWYHWAKSADCEWNRQNAADRYEVLWKNAKGKTVKSETVTYHGSTLSKVSNSMVYTIYVRAQQEFGGRTYYSNWASTKVFDQIFLKKATYKDGKITLTWPRMSGASGYDIYVGTSKSFAKFRKVKTVKAKTKSAVIKKFKGRKLSRKSYYVLVVARVKNGKQISTSGHTYIWQVKKGKTVGENQYVYSN